ncbi:2'-5' RNA ligase family protein [Sphingobacterium olei]|uniref:2'-5' RNA ligase family protein n=1 Tax=Sphingobacterium olei TaxID=2571155 RepID=A0A4U0NEF3_9SPHI|nr:2'-5' RNA ligase family protein [Sphingobacterium olei]TJZ52416.1 2'-5' RNA ligase family protein [Sphingobacterium olei]
MKYSLVIHPGADVIDYVKDLKKQLEQNIGWYASVNSLAHISICEFESDEVDVAKIKTKLIYLAEFEKAQYVYLSDFNQYKQHTFFIEPSLYSKAYLKDMFRRVINHLKPHIVGLEDKGNDPHVTIARKLDENKMAVAKKLFTHVDKSFFCDSFSLRKFNSDKGQYEIMQRFSFGNKNREEGQLSLF